MALQPLQHGDPHEIGSYRLLGRLGGGGMGRVFLGRSPGGRPVAVKLVLPGLAADDGFRRRFAQEVEAARRVGGFHTAQLVDADPAADPPWLVTAYVPGPSLQEAVEAHGPLPPRTVLALGAGLAEGLAAVHACGLVHRDLKPGNVILAADGPRIIDFGIARAADAAGLTATGSMIGTPGFMSPEQAAGERDLGPASDVFALGSVLTFAATGQGPFDGGSVPSVVYRIVSAEPDLASLPRPLRDLVAACLAKDPAARPAVADVLRELSAMTDREAEASGGWLPPAVTAMIAERRVSTGSDVPPQAPPRPSPADAPPPVSAPAYHVPPPAPPGPPPAHPGAASPYPGFGAYGGSGWEQEQGAWPPAGTAPGGGGWQVPGAPAQQYGQGHPAFGAYPPPPVATRPGARPPGPPGQTGPKLIAAGAGVLVLVCLAVAVYVLSSDGPRTSGERADGARAGVTEPSRPVEPSDTADPAAAVVGSWEGTYTCTQGLTGLQLTISESSAGGGLEATFRFFPHSSNPSVPSGSFAMRGTFTEGVLELNGDHWIDRPDDYLMVDLSARVVGERPAGISGTVKSSGSNCTAFSVQRR
jgi:serine/threonine protein kinase